MSAVDVLTTIGPAITLLEAFPVWGPVLAVVAALLLVQAARDTWGTDGDTSGDAVSGPVPTERDTHRSGPVTCGDTVPEESPGPGTGRA